MVNANIRWSNSKLLEMDGDDVECDLFRAGYIHIPIQPNVADQDESNTHERENDWHLLFPEAVQDINLSPRLNINDIQTSPHVHQLGNDQVDDTGTVVDHNNIQAQYDDNSTYDDDDDNDNDETNTSFVDTFDNIQQRYDSEQEDETNTNSVDTDDNIQQQYERDSEYDNDETKTNSVDQAFAVANISRVEGYNKQYSILSDSSSDDLIIIDHKLIGKQPNTSNNLNLFKHDEDVIVEDDPIEDTTTETLISSPMHTPEVQVMHKYEDKYDPKRIPSAVFDRCDSLIPAEWSATSNESLFSLNIGNASIGRDQAVLLSGEHGGLLRKSSKGDFTIAELQEIRKLAGLAKTNDGQLIISTSTVPRIDEAIGEGEDSHANKKVISTLFDQKDEEVMKLISAMKLEEEKQSKQQNIHSSSLSLHSNASEDSNYSFAFPM